jgi:hypothetical protein
MREVGHAGKTVNDRYTHPLEQAHLAASEQTAALVRRRERHRERDLDGCSHSVPIRRRSGEVTTCR